MNKLLLTLLSFVAFFEATWSYSFDDAIYNQIIANSFDDFSQEALVPYRSRRAIDAGKDHHCHGRHFSCCNQDVFDFIHKEGKPIFRECFKTVTGKDFGEGPPKDPFSCANMEKHKKDIVCVMKCFGQKKGMLDDDGNIKIDDVKNLLKQLFAEKEWIQPHLESYADKCFAEAKEETAKYDATDKDACNPSGMKFKHCLWKLVQLDCPADQISDEKKCNKIREFVKQTGDVFPPPRPPPIFD